MNERLIVDNFIYLRDKYPYGWLTFAKSITKYM